MSAINSPGACLSLDNKVAQLRDFPSLDILVLWKIWERLVSPEHTSTEHLKSVCCDWHWRVGRAFLMGVATFSLQFPLPQKARVREYGSVLNPMRHVHEFIRRSLLLTCLSALDLVRAPHRPKPQTSKPRKCQARGVSAFPPISMRLTAFHLGNHFLSVCFSHLNVYIACQSSGIT